jgi:hypothetical protein
VLRVECLELKISENINSGPGTAFWLFSTAADSGSMSAVVGKAGIVGAAPNRRE